MAVSSSKLVNSSGSVAIDGGSNFTLSYVVRASRGDTAHEAYLGAIGASPDPVPQKYDQLSTDLSLFCTSIAITPESRSEASSFMMDARFETLPAGQTKEDSNQDPRLRPAKIRLDWHNTTVELTKDVNGAAIVNTLNEQFPEPSQWEDSVPVFLIDKNYGTLFEILQIQRQFRFSKNASEFLGLPTGQARYEVTTAGNPLSENGIEFYPCTHRVAVDTRGWMLRRLNEGYVLENDDGKKVTDTEEAGQLTGLPVYLDEDGKKVASAGDAFEIEFDVLSPQNYQFLL